MSIQRQNQQCCQLPRAALRRGQWSGHALRYLFFHPRKSFPPKRTLVAIQREVQMAQSKENFSRHVRCDAETGRRTMTVKSTGVVAALLLATALALGGCAGQSGPASTSIPPTTTTTTTIPVTTTTVTSVGGFISTQWCPQYEVTGDGAFSIASGGAEVYYGVNATAAQIYSACMGNLKTQSWTVNTSLSSFGALGGVIEATQGAAWALITISPNSNPTVKVCTWPAQPSELSCP